VKGFVRSIGLDADEKKLPIDPAAIATHLNPGDMKAAWQNGLADEVARAFEEQLRLFQLQGTAMDPAQMNSKFADSLTHQRLRGPTGTWRSTLAASKNISGSRP
jgi:hypothetical protein